MVRCLFDPCHPSPVCTAGSLFPSYWYSYDLRRSRVSTLIPKSLGDLAIVNWFWPQNRPFLTPHAHRRRMAGVKEALYHVLRTTYWTTSNGTKRLVRGVSSTEECVPCADEMRGHGSNEHIQWSNYKWKRAEYWTELQKRWRLEKTSIIYQ